METRAALLLMSGGVAGAATRWAIQEWGSVTTFPWQTLLANLIGCAVLGALAGRPLDHPAGHRALTAGFCGGLTTLSGFALEVAVLRRSGADSQWLYPVVSIAAGLVALLAARALTRQVAR